MAALLTPVAVAAAVAVAVAPEPCCLPAAAGTVPSLPPPAAGGAPTTSTADALLLVAAAAAASASAPPLSADCEASCCWITSRPSQMDLKDKARYATETKAASGRQDISLQLCCWQLPYYSKLGRFVSCTQLLPSGAILTPFSRENK